MSAAPGMQQFLRRFEPVGRRLDNHQMYEALRNLDDMREFLRFHCFAVWDFMSLLKALQRHLTCMELAWRPLGTATARRLVNELILEEESDEIDGEATSHFEFYCRAMRDAGVDTAPIDTLLRLLANGVPVDDALAACGAPQASRAFVRTTFALIRQGKPHVIAAAFTFGREKAIPDMFGHLVGAISEGGDGLQLFQQYLDRHIALDGGSHAPKAVRMLEELCGDDMVKWDEAADGAIVAVEARIALWDAIAEALADLRREPILSTGILVAAE